MTNPKLGDTGLLMEKKGMTLVEFKTLKNRDWENGAVRDELYETVKAIDEVSKIPVRRIVEWAIEQGLVGISKEKLTVEVIRGVEGHCLGINNYRVAGPKPWGGGKVIHRFRCTADEALASTKEVVVWKGGKG